MHDKCYVRQSNKFCGLKMHEFLVNLSRRSFRFGFFILFTYVSFSSIYFPSKIKHDKTDNSLWICRTKND